VSLYVLDTDVVTLYGEGVEPLLSRIDARPPDELGITVITVEEQLTGWYNFIRQARQPADLAHGYRRLAEAIPFLDQWAILPFTEAAMARVVDWQKMRLNVRKMDLRIAAVALEHGAIVVTRNLRDFGRIPGVTAENWAA
jgi:tRNA(fMet)-specific endonuclease VapC